MAGSFREKDIQESFGSFYEASLNQFAALGIDSPLGKGRVQLTLDDRLITEKKDINCTNGRYYFRRPEAWNSYIPCAESSGVYFFFDKDGIGVYVGKSEQTGGLGRRVFAHIGPFRNGEYPNLEFPEAEYIIVIPFDEAPFLAVAFESYLLRKFEFAHNTQMNR